MGHIGQLPALLQFTPPAQPPPSAAAGIFSSASQYMDPSLRAAAGAAANAAANSAVGAAAAAAVAAAGAAAAAWPVQVAANYLCLLETARVLLAAPHSSTDDQRAQVRILAVKLLLSLVLPRASKPKYIAWPAPRCSCQAGNCFGRYSASWVSPNLRRCGGNWSDVCGCLRYSVKNVACVCAVLIAGGRQPQGQSGQTWSAGPHAPAGGPLNTWCTISCSEGTGECL